MWTYVPQLLSAVVSASHVFLLASCVVCVNSLKRDDRTVGWEENFTAGYCFI